MLPVNTMDINYIVPLLGPAKENRCNMFDPTFWKINRKSFVFSIQLLLVNNNAHAGYVQEATA